MASVIRQTSSLLMKSRSNFFKTQHLTSRIPAHQKSTTASEPNISNEPDLKLSDACVKRLNSINSGDGTNLRLVVEGGGCSGYQYKFELDSEVQDDDRLIERDGAKVIVDEASLDLIKGSTIDFHQELIRSSFVVVDNPQAEQGCSCGASFNVKF